jgi:hypothetical protein
LLPDEIKEI